MMKKLFFLVSLLLLSSCGFHLRENFNLPPQFHTLYLKSNAPYSELSKDLQKRLKLIGITVVDSPAKSSYVLEILSDKVDEVANSVSADTKVREYTLIYTVRYQILNRNGNIIQIPTDVSTTRHYIEQSVSALGASNERNRLEKEMRRDLITQLFYRLSARNLEKALNAPASNTSQQ